MNEIEREVLRCTASGDLSDGGGGMGGGKGGGVINHMPVLGRLMGMLINACFCLK